MSIRQLEALYWTTKLGSFTRAAEHLKISQSAISTRIDELESYLRVKLFHRGHHAPKIAPKGRELVRFAEQILRLCADAQEQVSRGDIAPDEFRIGFAEVISMAWLPRLVHAIHDRFPKVSLTLEEGLADEVFAKLKRGALDLVLGAGWPRDHQVHVVPVGRVQFEWMASPSLPLRRGSLMPTDLQQWPMIALSRESIHYETINDWFVAGGATCQRIYTCKSMHVASVLAAAGLGITLLPTKLYQDQIKRKQLRVIPTKPHIPAIEFFAISAADNLDPFIREAAQLAATSSTFEKTKVE